MSRNLRPRVRCLIEQIGPYQVLRVIGVGGMGTVYEALKPGIERRVAIKILHPDLAARPDARARLSEKPVP